MDEQVSKMLFIRNRMDIAYNVAPIGSWFKRWIPFICKHDVIRCTHGDEIIGRNFHRRVCIICGRSLNGPLPEKCFFTGEPHMKES